MDLLRADQFSRIREAHLPGNDGEVDAVLE